MIKEIDYKVVGGKLIRIKADVEENILKNVKITGDFFLHPEEKIELIEKNLRNKKLEREELERAIRKVVHENEIQLLGVSEKDFVDAIMQIKSEK